MRHISRTFDGFSGLGKHFYVNNSQVFSSEMHPRSGIQAIYDNQGDLIVKVEEYQVPPRKLWSSNLNKIHIVDEHFDYQRRLLQWTWGPRSESYHYDSSGHMTQVMTI